MGHVYKTEGSEWFFIDYFDAAGRRHRRRASKSKAEAKDLLGAAEHEASRERLLGIKPLKRMGFEDFGEMFIKYAGQQVPKSCGRYEVSFKVLKAFFGNQPLTTIEPESIERFKQKRASDVTPASTNRDLQVLRRMFNLAIPWGYLRENPVRYVKFFRESSGRIRYLAYEEYERLMKECPEHLRPLVVTAVNTGMRQGEMLALTWADIDFENGFISVNDPKNRTPRKVPMNGRVRIELHELRSKGLSLALFHDDKGMPLIARTVQWQFRRLLRHAKIEGFRFHDLRHTCASWLAMAGVPILTIRDVLGHKDIRMTMRYAHLSPDQRVDAVNKLDEVIRRKIEKEPPEASAAVS